MEEKDFERIIMGTGPQTVDELEYLLTYRLHDMTSEDEVQLLLRTLTDWLGLVSRLAPARAATKDAYKACEADVYQFLLRAGQLHPNRRSLDKRLLRDLRDLLRKLYYHPGEYMSHEPQGR